MTKLLEFDDVRALYNGALVLDGITFSVERGETVGLLGRNGAGKTTTLLSTYSVPQVRGQIRINGKPIDGRAYRPASSGICLVPQGRRIFGNLSVEENIMLGRSSRRTTEWTLHKLYDLFPNLGRGAKRKGSALSGGEQQMLAIARALMAGPDLLLLDEPTEGLAPVIIDELVEVLKVIQERGTSLLLVEQHIKLVQELATRYVALGKGRVVSSGSVDGLSSKEVQDQIAI
jgi:branched-chain amino acid transport system ATP-binding protein